ncbi:MAG: hypothetical protein ABW023_03505 [Sphingomonas sp.]
MKKLLLLAMALFLPGTASAQYNEFHGFIYANGTYQQLDYGHGYETLLYGINDSGVIIGSARGIGNPQDSFEFVYSNGQFDAISVPGSDHTYVADIADNGTIVGSYSPAGSGGLAGFIRDAAGNYTTFQAPGSPGSATYIMGTNGSDAVGYAGDVSSGKFQGFILDKNGNYSVFAQDGGGYLSDINADGDLLGWKPASYPADALNFAYIGGQRVVYPSITNGLRASKINDNGDVLFLDPSIDGHSELFYQGSWFDIAAFGAGYTSAMGLNNLGQVVGAFLYTPAPGVPEPYVWALLVAGFGIAGASLRYPLRARSLKPL